MEATTTFAPQHVGTADRAPACHQTEEHAMSIARTTEIIAAGSTVEDAIDKGVARATETLKNVQEVWVESIKGRVDGGRVAEYRVAMKVTFVLEGT
jgi:flavin-binding protein dodecin